MKKYILFFLILVFVLYLILTGFLGQVKTYDKITILDQMTLSYERKDGIRFMGISDVAYDRENKKLYMLSDRSVLYGLSATFDEKIKEIRYDSVHKLRSPSNRHYDSEGLTLDHKNKLLLSHERSAGIIQISNDAKVIKSYKLPAKLSKRSNYRDKNKLLESIVAHPEYGLLTAAEFPLRKKQYLREQTIYALNGKEWHFKMQNYPNIAITAPSCSPTVL